MKKKDADEIPFIIAQASMRGMMHIFRLLVNRGLISPQDVEESSAGVIAVLEKLPAELHGSLNENVVSSFAEMKEVAAANWKGE